MLVVEKGGIGFSGSMGLKRSRSFEYRSVNMNSFSKARARRCQSSQETHSLASAIFAGTLLPQR